jgi:hypothetical protein
MQTFKLSTFLRYVLFADAATCMITGLAMSVGTGLVGSLTGLPSHVLLYAGIGLMPFAALLVYLGTRREVSSAAFWTVIVINILWTLDSFLLLASGWVEPTAFGYAFVTFQAMGVAGFAALEYLGLRKAAAKTTA